MTLHSTPLDSPLTAYVEGIGLLGPGLPNWAQGRQYLDGCLTYVPARCALPLPMALPTAERRRAGAVVKVSLAVGQEAVAASGLQAHELLSVFSSSSGDAVNCHEICSALASGDPLISPTRFHNSVHNAASGYWSISSGAMASASVLCGRDASFSAALLEAIAQVTVDENPVLLVAYDTDYPEPLHNKRPVPDSMGVALVLRAQRSERSLARIDLQSSGYLTTVAADALKDTALEALRLAIPAARALPLLQAIAKISAPANATRETVRLVLTYLDDVQLALAVSPC